MTEPDAAGGPLISVRVMTLSFFSVMVKGSVEVSLTCKLVIWVTDACFSDVRSLMR